MKRLIVWFLERFCHYVWDGLLVRFELGAWFFYDVLDVPICPFASWSFRLDKRWETGLWGIVEKDDA